MRRNIHVMYKNFRGIVLTKTLLGFSKRLVVRRWLMNGMKMCKG